MTFLICSLFIHLGELIQDITFTRNGFFGLNGGAATKNRVLCYLQKL